MSGLSLSCLAGLDAIEPLHLCPSSTSSSPHQLPLFSTFLGSFTSSPYLLLSSTGPSVSRENMPVTHRNTATVTRPSKPRIKSLRSRVQPCQQSAVSPDAPLEVLPPLPPMPAITLPTFTEPSTPRVLPTKLHHPNSPYVPWSQPTRRQIITPSNNSSLDRCYSRTGARAPEPPSLSSKQPPRTTLSKLCRRVKSIASRFIPVSSSKCEGVATVVGSRRHDRGSDAWVHRHPGVDSDSELYTPTPHRSAFLNDAHDHSPNYSSESHSLYSHSTGTESAESFESASLQVWLAARIQQNDAPSDKVGMTLEEYDRRGSWLRVHSKRSLATSHTFTSTTTTTTTGATGGCAKHRSVNGYTVMPSPLSTCATVSQACAETGHD